MKKYDYLVVGAGLAGAMFAHEAFKRGKKVKVIDKRNHIGGNLYCEKIENINVHKYGAHIFHTSNKVVWDYVNQFTEFNNFINSPLAIYEDKLFNLPFNMNTFHQLWNINTPDEAKRIINLQTAKYQDLNPSNLKLQALKLVGDDIYKYLIEGYTEKQWGKKCEELPAFIIKRLPLRFTYNNNYFKDRYQGIPINGYNVIINKMLEGIEVELEKDFFKDKTFYQSLADKIIFTGKIDQYYDYEFGKLEYRSLKFEHEILATENFQGNAVVNYTEKKIPYTRIIEHKHFEDSVSDKTIITKEYPITYSDDVEPYYPINDDKNNALYQKYHQLALNDNEVIFLGRLAEYKYYDMNVLIERILNFIAEYFK